MIINIVENLNDGSKIARINDYMTFVCKTNVAVLFDLKQKFDIMNGSNN